MELNGDQPPLVWPQFESAEYRRRRSPASAFFSPSAIILTYTIAFLLISIFILPPFLSITSQILRPVSVMKSWDSINVFLVLFAILCGVLARQNGDGSPSSLHGGDERAVTGDSMNAGEDDKISSSVSGRWFSDVYAGHRLKIHESVRSSAPSPVTGTVRLRRSSSSYPDLRQAFFGDTVDHHFRFYDDFEINKYRSPVIANSDGYERIQNRRKIQIEKSEPKEIPVDKFEVRPPTPPREPPAPRPPQPLSAEVVQKPRRGHRSVRSRATPENVRHRDTDSNSTQSEQGPPPAPAPPLQPPPPPPPPPFTPPRTALRNEAERKQGKLERRKSNAAKEIKMVLASLYNQRKRKLQKAKTKRNEYPVTEPPHYQSKIPPPSPPPPPPPPPPPRSSQSVFYGLFRKGSKSKKIHSVPAPPPQLPPPSSRTSKRKIQLDRHSHPPPPPPPAPPMSPRRRSGKPPRPTKPTNFNEDNYVNSGRESPLIPIPPPPPPPFRVPPLKFVVRGDFAKIQSNQSSRCSSPERGEVIDLGWGLELTQSEEGDRIGRSENSRGRSFCQSPDVDTKADSFIARLRDEWRLESVHPIEKETGLRPKPNM